MSARKKSDRLELMQMAVFVASGLGYPYVLFATAALLGALGWAIGRTVLGPGAKKQA